MIKKQVKTKIKPLHLREWYFKMGSLKIKVPAIFKESADSLALET